MGNSVPKYYTVEEAKAIIGAGRWISLKKQLEYHRGKGIDFDGIQALLRERFERMVS
jgi:hypothetical protein